MSGAMGNTEVFSILVSIAGFLLSGHHVAAEAVFETTVSSVIGAALSNVPNTCPSYEVNAGVYCVPGLDLTELNGKLESGLSDKEACSAAYSLQQFACSDASKIEAASVSSLVSILKCYTTNSNVLVNQDGFTLLISKLSTAKLQEVLDAFATQVSISSLQANAKLYMLTAVLENIRSKNPSLAPGFLATWFQERLYPFLPALNVNILSCISALPISCDGFQAIVEAFDVASINLADAEKQAIGRWITTFLREHTCKKSSAIENINAFYRGFKSFVSVSDYTSAFGSIDLSSALVELPAFQVAQYANSISAFDSFATAAPVLEILKGKDLSYTISFMDTFSKISTMETYNLDVTYSLLEVVLAKFNTVESELCLPNFKEIFQFKIKILLVAVNETILSQLPSYIDCSAFQDILVSLDQVYNNLSAESQQAVFNYRLNFLNAEAKKSGGGCNYGVNSVTWLQSYFGPSISLVSYSELVKLNPNFNGYEALDLLTINQTLDLIVASNILVEVSENFEYQISALSSSLQTKGFAYLKIFLFEFRQILFQYKIVFIQNTRFSCAILDRIWEILSSQYPGFSSDDWYNWFSEYLTVFLPCLKKAKLDVLSISTITSCSNFQVIVKGLDNGFGYMDQSTKQDIVAWISDILKTTKCDSSEWLKVNWQQFVTVADITVIAELNPDLNLIDSLDQFTTTQIGQIVVASSEAQTDVEVIKKIFNVVLNVSSEEIVSNLGIFWDGLNAAYSESTTVNVTTEVKYEMLSTTSQQLEVRYEEFTEKDFKIWYEERLSVVLDTIDSTVLKAIPLNISCASYGALVSAFNGKYKETPEKNKNDVFQFLNNYQNEEKKEKKCTNIKSSSSWISTYYGEYISNLSYEQLTTYYSEFNAYEEGVLVKMSDTQIGDLIAVSDTLNSQESCTKLFDHLETLDVVNVDIIIKQFTETAIKKKIVIENTEVATFFLESYLQIVTSEVQTYTEVQLTELLEKKIYLLLRFVTSEALSLLGIKTCSSLTIVVTHFGGVSGDLSKKAQRIIAVWILGLLQLPELKGCQKPTETQTQTEWITTTFGIFFQSLTYNEIISVNSEYNIIEDLSIASVSQKAYYLTTGNVVNDITVVVNVLNSLKVNESTVSVSTITSFLQEFNATFSQNVNQTILIEVKQEVFSFLFSSYVVDVKILEEEVIANFQADFQYFLSGITVEALQLIPDDLSCNQYENIFSAFSSVYGSLTEEIKQAVYDAIINYLNANKVSGSTSEKVCKSLYTNTTTYLSKIYFEFVPYATFDDLISFYSEFNAYEVLYKFSGKQLGNLLINSTAIKDEMEAVQILVELKKSDKFEVVTEFITEINTVAEEKNIQNLPNANIESLIFNTVWSIVSKELNTAEEYNQWFVSELSLVLSSASTAVIESISSDIDCDSQKAVVEGFSKVIEKLSEEQSQSIVSRIKSYQQDQKKLTGSACGSDKSSSEWIKEVCGGFSESFTLADFKELNQNFSVVEALSSCTGSQIAEYTITSGALKNETLIVQVLENLDTYVEVVEFYSEVNKVAEVALQTSSEIELIVQSTFQTISSTFETLTEQQYGVLFQETLVNVLPAVQEPQLELIPSPLPCKSYQQVLKGFNKAYEKMEDDTKQLVYDKFIARQFNNTSSSSGVPCGSPDDRTQDWIDINLGQFSQNAQVTDIIKWNQQFVATDVIATLSVEQLAAVIVQEENINNEELVCQLLGRLKKSGEADINVFLKNFNINFEKLSYQEVPVASIRYNFLSEFVTLLKGQFKLYSVGDWEILFSEWFQPFLSSITDEELNVFLSSANCNSYAVIVKYLSAIYDKLSADVQKSLFKSLYVFRTGSQYLGHSCPGSGGTTKEKINIDFGNFFVLASYEELVAVYQDFNGLDIINDLSAEQCASLIFNGAILNNEDNANILVKKIQGFSFGQIDIFLTNFQVNAIKKNLIYLQNEKIRTSLWNAIYGVISGQFKFFSVTQWINFWEQKLILFLPSITESQISFFSDIDCNVYQIVISGLNKVYSHIPSSTQKAIYNAAYAFLWNQLQATGSACSTNTIGSKGWLQTNLASFSFYGSYANITSLNANFIATDALSSLSVQQLAQYTLVSDALTSSDKITLILNFLNSNNLGAYLDEFNIQAEQAGITQLSNLNIKNIISGEIFCKIGSGFVSFSLEDYQLWFGKRLKLFLSSVSAKTLGSLPKDLSCDKLEYLVNVFNSYTNVENPSDIYNFILAILQQQYQNSGSACVTASNSGKQWITIYFGSFSKYAQWSDITSIYADFPASEAAGFLNGQELASAVVTTTVIYTVDSISSIFLSFGNNTDIMFSFISALRTAAIEDGQLLSNIKVRDFILQASSSLFFSKVNNVPLSTAQKWFSTLSFLLPGINSTILENWDLGTPCPYFQSFNQYLNSNFHSLSSSQQADVYAFVLKYLKHQLEVNGSPCTADATFLSWLMSFVGQNICSVSNPEDIQALNQDFSLVSYNAVCKLGI